MINYHDDLLGDELAAFETFDPLLFESAIEEYDRAGTINVISEEEMLDIEGTAASTAGYGNPEVAEEEIKTAD